MSVNANGYRKTSNRSHAADWRQRLHSLLGVGFFSLALNVGASVAQEWTQSGTDTDVTPVSAHS